MTAGFKRVAQTEEEKGTPPIVKVMTKEQFQYAFKVQTESSSSSASGPHHTIWKELSSSDYCAEFLCIMICLPFMYGFTNNRWLCKVDVMLGKRRAFARSTCYKSLAHGSRTLIQQSNSSLPPRCKLSQSTMAYIRVAVGEPQEQIINQCRTGAPIEPEISHALKHVSIECRSASPISTL